MIFLGDRTVINHTPRVIASGAVPSPIKDVLPIPDDYLIVSLLLLSFLPLTYSVILIASLSLVAFPFILESAYGQYHFRCLCYSSNRCYIYQVQDSLWILILNLEYLQYLFQHQLQYTLNLCPILYLVMELLLITLFGEQWLLRQCIPSFYGTLVPITTILAGTAYCLRPETTCKELTCTFT